MERFDGDGGANSGIRGDGAEQHNDSNNGQPSKRSSWEDDLVRRVGVTIPRLFRIVNVKYNEDLGELEYPATFV